jgi:quinohemoprotein ethanol dehydrogenase
LCHGPGAVNGGSQIPDLRNTPEAIYELMPSILEKGALRQGGMPQFPYFSDDDINALQAYIINQAWASYEAQQGGKKLPSTEGVE